MPQERGNMWKTEEEYKKMRDSVLWLESKIIKLKRGKMIKLKDLLEALIPVAFTIGTIMVLHYLLN